MTKNNKMKIVLPAILGSLVVGTGFGSLLFPQTSVVEKIVDHNVSVDKIVEVPVNVTVEKIVEVDNGNLDLVLQDVFDNKGNVSYATAGLKDSEISQIADRIIFSNEIKTMSISDVDSHIKSFLNGVVVGNTTLSVYDINNIRVNAKTENVTLKNIDFTYNDATAVVSGKFEQNHVKFSFVAEASYVDNKFDRITSVSVN